MENPQEFLACLMAGDELHLTVLGQGLILHEVAEPHRPVGVHRSATRQENSYPARVEEIEVTRDGKRGRGRWIVLSYKEEQVGMAVGAWHLLLYGEKPAIELTRVGSTNN